MGLGGDYYPIPWQALTYVASREAFATDITEDKLKAAPTYEKADLHDREEARRIHQHFGVPFSWRENCQIPCG